MGSCLYIYIYIYIYASFQHASLKFEAIFEATQVDAYVRRGGESWALSTAPPPEVCGRPTHSNVPGTFPAVNIITVSAKYDMATSKEHEHTQTRWESPTKCPMFQRGTSASVDYFERGVESRWGLYVMALKNAQGSTLSLGEVKTKAFKRAV